MQNQPKRIILLSSAEDEHSVPINNEFVGALQQRLGNDIRIEWHNYHDIRIEFTTDRIEVMVIPEQIPLSSFDFVYIKSYFRYSELAGVLATYLEQTNTSFVCSELKNHIALTKLGQLARLSTAHLPIAKTLFLLPPVFRRSYQAVSESLGVPFIFKSIDGSGGDENYLIKSEAEFIAALDAFPELKFIAQAFIPNESDMRVLIVGGEIKLIIKRQRKDDATHLNNTSQGADATILPLEALPEAERQMSLEAAKIMGREIAGVDLLHEKDTKNPYILEVNASPQIGSGAFTDEKLDIYSNYFKNMVK